MAGTRERAHDLVQLLRILSGQGRGRLVHDDQVGAARKRAQDLDLLLVGRAQGARDRVRAQLEPRLGGEGVEARLERATLDESEAAGFGSEKDVLGDRQARHEGQFLGDGRDAVGERLTRRAEAHGLAVDLELAPVGGQQPGDDLAERRLACAVLPDEPVNRAAD
ncbi:MAG: hypothetical protein WDM88_01725 [Galbitalea sp.]